MTNSVSPSGELAAITTARTGLGAGQRFWSIVKEIPWLPATILGLLIIAAAGAPYITPHNPEANKLMDSMIPPFWEQGGSFNHILGTDQLGRDVFTRILYGARLSLLIGFSAVGLSSIFGSTLGVIAGYFGRFIDSLLMRLVDMQMSMPAILVLIALAGALKPSVKTVIIVIVIWNWAQYARLVRGAVLSLKTRDYVALAKVAGISNASIMWHHIAPNVVNTVLVLASLDLGAVIILEASLSFLGLGAQPPTPTWGLMLSEGRQFITTAWYLAVFPGIAIMLTVLSMNLLGDWLRDRLDPMRRHL